MPDDIKSKVKALYEVMKDESICDIEVSSKDYNIKIKRKKHKSQNIQQTANTSISAVESDSAVSSISKSTTTTLSETIKSPVTGVFYASASPGSPAFVKDGDTVEIGTTVCIIEAMKVMNEIKAFLKVKIVRSLVKNGVVVQAEQDLFDIERV
ncbi:MAG: hypothetical protein LBU55_02215 [Elusimicrobiota bacterium]|jgi:acetyl-CoA carboxylase biotin carboxyl carrier protein|nr:hypothetical protein [Elusimicrobiota bacterium]